MGLLDGILGGVVGSAQNPLEALLGGLAGGGGVQGNHLLGAALSMVQSSGGLGALLDKFRQQGLAQHVDSWVGSGPNLGISGAQLQQALGGSALEGIASRLGLSTAQAGSAMAQVLPELVNQLTPAGRVPDDHQDILARAMDALGIGS